MLGFPPEDEEIFRDIIHLILDLIDLPSEVRGPMFEPVGEYFAKQIDDHIEHPRDDLTSYLLNVEVGGHKLERQHVSGTIVLILVAGIDTTWSAIGSAIWHLARHPEDLARLVNEPELLPVAVEEFLRFYAPVTMARLVAEDYEFFGCPMKKDDWVLLGFPAANRDPEAFEDADSSSSTARPTATRPSAWASTAAWGRTSRASRLTRRDRGVHQALPAVRTGRPRRGDVVARPGARTAPPPASRTALGPRARGSGGALVPESGHPRLDVVGLARQRAPRGSSSRRGDEDVVFDANADAAVLLGHREVVRLEVEARFDREDVALVELAAR